MQKAFDAVLHQAELAKMYSLGVVIIELLHGHILRSPSYYSQSCSRRFIIFKWI